MRESPYPMIQADDALARILTQVSRLPSVTRPFNEARGLVLAEDLYAREPLPPFPASTVDGFAVVAADGTEERVLVGEQFAGKQAHLHVARGQAARVTTGAPIPRGADAVMMVEWSEEEAGRVRFSRAVEAGHAIRAVGSDIAPGESVLMAGRQLGPAELGLLATVGVTEVKVYRPPVVGVMSTGDELVEPHQPPGPGQIRDANRYALMAAVQEAGAEALDLGIAPDQSDTLERFIEEGLGRCDVLLSSGGVSMGERDLVKPFLEAAGKVHFGRVCVKPGKPLTFATLRAHPFFALPGNPVSSLVSFELFVRPALCKMQGLPAWLWHRPRIWATLEQRTFHSPERLEYQRAYLRFNPTTGRFYARTTGSQASSRLLSMVGANALLQLPEGQGDVEMGQQVEALLIGPLL